MARASGNPSPLETDAVDVDTLAGPDRPSIVALPQRSTGEASVPARLAQASPPAKVQPSQAYHQAAAQIRGMKLARPAKTELLKLTAQLTAQTVIEEQAAEEAKQVTRTVADEAVGKIEAINALERALGGDPAVDPEYFAVLRANVVTSAGNRITESEERRARTLRELDALPDLAAQWIKPTLLERVDDALAGVAEGISFGASRLEKTERQLSPLQVLANYGTLGHIAYQRIGEQMREEREGYEARHRAAQAGFAGEIIDVDPQ